MQHMGVMRTFNVTYYLTNYVTNMPAIAAVLSAPIYNPSQFQFTVTGSAGSNYVVQSSTNLSAANWVSLKTNASPFTFTDTSINSHRQRFYRALAL